jgi:hypothetical protein
MPDENRKTPQAPLTFPRCELDDQECDDRRRLRAVEELNARTLRKAH